MPLRRLSGANSVAMLAALLLALSAGAARAQDDVDPYEAELSSAEISDPLEGANRGIFVFNDFLDRYALEPVSKGWDFVLPDVVERSLKRAVWNFRFPVVFVNDLLQFKPKEAGIDLARFVINSSIGIGGLMDPAEKFGLARNAEDFGQTLGVWGLPAGPYLMIPFLGPANLRDGIGLIVDSLTNPASWFLPFVATVSVTGVDVINSRSLIGETIENEREASLDWYASVRSAYSQYREKLIRDDEEMVGRVSSIVGPEEQE